MGVAEILNHIEHEIAQLQRARALLQNAETKTSRASSIHTTRKKTKKRNLTPEGRRRIAEAVKRRWEKHRKAASGK